MVKQLLLGAVIAGSLGACYAQDTATVAVATPAPAPVVTGGPSAEVDEAPPPPQVYVAAVRPGYIYIDGRWEWRGRWVWRGGYYERERPGFAWEPGQWTVRGHHHVWVEGRWYRR